MLNEACLVNMISYTFSVNALSFPLVTYSPAPYESPCMYATISIPSSMGAAVVVENNLVPDVYSMLFFNPLCFILYENATQFPEQWENVSCKHIYSSYLPYMYIRSSCLQCCNYAIVKRICLCNLQCYYL